MRSLNLEIRIQRSQSSLGYAIADILVLSPINCKCWWRKGNSGCVAKLFSRFRPYFQRFRPKLLHFLHLSKCVRKPSVVYNLSRLIMISCRSSYDTLRLQSITLSHPLHWIPCSTFPGLRSRYGKGVTAMYRRTSCIVSLAAGVSVGVLHPACCANALLSRMSRR
jgi:hypothetical protein